MSKGSSANFSRGVLKLVVLPCVRWWGCVNIDATMKNLSWKPLRRLIGIQSKSPWEGKEWRLKHELEGMWWQYVVIDMNGGVEVSLVRWTHNHNMDTAVVAPKVSGWMRVCGLWNRIPLARLPMDGVEFEAMHFLDQLWMELSLRQCTFWINYGWSWVWGYAWVTIWGQRGLNMGAS